jgi:hypothetical protein
MKSIPSANLNSLVITAFISINMLLGPITPFQIDARAENKEPESEDSQQRWTAFPILASSPETGFIFGGMLFHFFPVDDLEEQASTIDLMTFMTTEKQFLFVVSPNIFWQNSRYRFQTSFLYSSWIANFYGIGNESPDHAEEYESESFGASFTFERKIRDTFILGILGSYSYENMSTQARGMLQSADVIGIEDYKYGGLGYRIGYDARDNTNSPGSGSLAVYEAVWAEKFFGSDYNFSLQSLDLRYYIPFSSNNVLAFSAQIRDSNGQVPFRLLPSPDGTMLLRGIENGRYRDDLMVGMQGELRFPVWKRFSGTVFAEAAQVAHEFSDIEISSFTQSLGIGFRYALNPDQRFNLRADLAWVDNGFGAIINVREAF